MLHLKLELDGKEDISKQTNTDVEELKKDLMGIASFLEEYDQYPRLFDIPISPTAVFAFVGYIISVTGIIVTDILLFQ